MIIPLENQVTRKRDSKYKNIVIYINFFLLFFPAFSISYLLFKFYFQSRILAVPLMVSLWIVSRKSIKLNILYIPLLISLVIPLAGISAGRTFSFIDIGYFLSFIYIIVFIELVKTRQKKFISFITIFTWSNIVFCLVQLILMNLGLSHLAMIQNNLPSHSEYILPPNHLLPYLYRYTGLFNESSPLIFYLCSAYCFLDELKLPKTYWLKFATFVAIFFAGSKFSYLFLMTLWLPKVLHYIPAKIRNIAFLIVTVIASSMILKNFSEIVNFSTQNIPAFYVRFVAIENALFNRNFFLLGNGFVSSASRNSGELDAFTIIFSGYGLGFGFIILCSFLIFILKSQIKSKFMLSVVYMLGLVSNGSFLISQYPLLLGMVHLLDIKNKQEQVYFYKITQNKNRIKI
jgi:hypothetical protein